MLTRRRTVAVEVYSAATKTLAEAQGARLGRLAVELAPAEVKLLHIRTR